VSEFLGLYRLILVLCRLKLNTIENAMAAAERGGAGSSGGSQAGIAVRRLPSTPKVIPRDFDVDEDSNDGNNNAGDKNNNTALVRILMMNYRLHT
jgi:hypothetical protein